MALYYYTSVENDSYSGDRITYWQTHDEESLSKFELAELRVSKGLTQMARTLLSPGPPDQSRVPEGRQGPEPRGIVARDVEVGGRSSPGMGFPVQGVPVNS